MNFPFYIAKRYSISFSNNNAINIISIIASLGIVIGTTVLFVLLSIFSGLKVFSLSFSNDFDPDLKVLPSYGKSFTISKAELDKIKKLNCIAFYSKVVEERALFFYQDKEHVAYIKGVDSQYGLVNKVDKALYQGQWLQPETPQVVLGNTITQKLSLGLNDLYNALEIYVPKPGKGAISNPREAFNKSNLVPVGIYAINDELDAKFVFADLRLTQDLLNFAPNQVTGLEIKLTSIEKESSAIKDLKAIFKNKVILKNREQLNDSLYKMLNTENTVLYLICLLVIILFLLMLVGAIIMMVLDKKENLKTLYKIGVEVKDLRKIFLYQGSLLTVIGCLLGLMIGVVLVLVQQHFSLIMITPTLAYPVLFTIQNIVIVFLTMIPLGIVASVIASSSVNKRIL